MFGDPPAAERQRISNRHQLAEHVRSVAGARPLLIALFLDDGLGLAGKQELGEDADAIGRSSGLLMRRARELGAMGFLLAQHAPGRRIGPSEAERAAARKLRRIGDDLDIHLLDYFIITDEQLFQVAG